MFGCLLPFVIAIAPAINAVVLDATTVGIVNSDGTMAIVTLADAMAGRDTGASLRLLADEPIDAAGLTANYRAEYESAVGRIIIEQPCRAFLTIDECVAAFKRAVEASQRAFPRV